MMRALYVVSFVLGVALSVGDARPAPLAAVFHHIHVNDPDPEALIDYYARLFDPVTTRRTRLGDVLGIEAEGVFLLVNAVPDKPIESGAAGWHFGWGTVSLDEAYDQHRMQEIDLVLPISSFAKNLHLHLESENPVRAAEWYRDRLSARIATRPENARVPPPNPLHRRPAAIVMFPGATFAVYQAQESLASSRGHRIDHVAFSVDIAAVPETWPALESPHRLGPLETRTIEGPDRLAIELVGHR